MASIQREEDAGYNKNEHALSQEGIPTNHLLRIKRLPEATPVCNALGKGPAHRQFSGHGGWDSMREQRSRPEIRLHRPGNGVRQDSGGSGEALQGTSLHPIKRYLVSITGTQRNFQQSQTLDFNISLQESILTQQSQHKHRTISCIIEILPSAPKLEAEHWKPNE